MTSRVRNIPLALERITDPKIIRRFQKYVRFCGNKNGQWLWTGGLADDGYGRFTINLGGKRRTLMAHRVAYAIFVGPIPEGMTVNHKSPGVDEQGNPVSPNPLDVHPTHLELMSWEDNVRERNLRVGRMIAIRRNKCKHCKRFLHPKNGDTCDQCIDISTLPV